MTGGHQPLWFSLSRQYLLRPRDHDVIVDVADGHVSGGHRAHLLSRLLRKQSLQRRHHHQLILQAIDKATENINSNVNNRDSTTIYTAEAKPQMAADHSGKFCL